LADDGQRIDRWLWHARVVRTRPVAAELAESGRVRVNGQRINAPARTVRTGDVLTIALRDSVKILRVTGFAERRGSASDASPLYEDLSEPVPPRRLRLRPPTPAAIPAPAGLPNATAARSTACDNVARIASSGWFPATQRPR
jgi:ribosome-associated heat shock protein Hsp15